MDGNLVIMIIFLAGMGMATGIVTDWLKTKRTVARSRAESASEVNPDIQKQLDDISRRLVALETIVTDEDRILRGEIEALRQRADNASV